MSITCDAAEWPSCISIVHGPTSANNKARAKKKHQKNKSANWFFGLLLNFWVKQTQMQRDTNDSIKGKANGRPNKKKCD